jgi:hypothetical protein
MGILEIIKPQKGPLEEDHNNTTWPSSPQSGSAHLRGQPPADWLQGTHLLSLFV